MGTLALALAETPFTGCPRAMSTIYTSVLHVREGNGGGK